MKMKYLKNISPFLVAVFTCVNLWAANMPRFDITETGTPLLYSLLVAGIFLALFWTSRWFTYAAPLCASVFTFLFLCWYINPWPLSIWFMAVTLSFAWFFDTDKLRIHINRIQSFLPFFLTILIIVSLSAGYMNQGNFGGLKLNDDYQYTEGQPNIYFIVPDRMPSPEAMAETGIDYGETVEALRAEGFIVPEDLLSHDQYTLDYSGPISTTRTMRFFASALNGEGVSIDIDYSQARSLISYSTMFETIHEKGYEIRNVASWFVETAHFPTADQNYNYNKISWIERLFYSTEFRAAYFNRVIISRLHIRAWESDSSIARVEKGRHQWQFDTLVDLASSGKTSQFVISHVMLPHEPFVYTDSKDQMQQYIDQIYYALDYIYQLATAIRQADPTAYIVIQADEGMAFQKPRSINEGLSPIQWNGVFAAWYLPQDLGDLSEIEHYEILSKVVNYGGSDQ